MSFGPKLAVIGAVGAVSSYAWWFSFYSDVVRLLGIKGSPPIECLYQVGGPCGLIVTASQWVGVTPYKPGYFILSVLAMVIGTIIYLYDAIRDGMTPPSMGRYDIDSPRPGRTRDFD